MTQEHPQASAISDWVPIPLDWPGELVEWSAPPIWGPPGAVASVLAHEVQVCKVGPLLDRRLGVLVLLEAGGASHRLAFVQRSAAKPNLQSLRELGVYVHAIAGSRGVPQLAAEVETLLNGDDVSDLLGPRWRFAQGPALSTMTLSQFMGLNEDLRQLERIDGRVSIDGDNLTYLLECAYQLGMEVREERLPDDIRRSKALASGLKRSESALAWKRDFLRWLQAESERENLVRRTPMTFDDLVDYAIRAWPKAGFQKQKVAPRRGTLLAAIREGRKAGWFKHHPAKAGRKPASS